MSKKDGNVEQIIEQEVQIETTKDGDVKSPPISFRTRSGRSKIPVISDKNHNIENEKLDQFDKLAQGEPMAEQEYSTDSEPEILEQEANIDPEKAEKHAEEVTAMSNEELKERLTTLGITIGPLVPSTRKIYEKKLINLMNKADLQYSTDEDESASVGAIAEEVKAEEPPVQKKKAKRGRPKQEESTVQDKFSDDEEIPVVQNSSSRRRSSRRAVTTKAAEQVEVDEPISEEAEEQVENGSVPIVVENGTGDAEGTEEVVSQEVDEPVVDETVVEENTEEVPQANQAPIPWHTIAVVSIVVLLLGLIWQQRDQHARWMTQVYELLVAQYTPIYNYLVPGVRDDMMPDIESLQDETP